jgi:hypothetical protein
MIDDYKDRLKKTKVWTEVYQFLMEGFDNFKEYPALPYANLGWGKAIKIMKYETFDVPRCSVFLTLSILVKNYIVID